MNQRIDREVWKDDVRRWCTRGIAALALAGTTWAQEPLYQEQDGILVIEFEGGDAAGNWVEESTVAGSTGGSYLRWQGPNYFAQPAHDPFGFNFELQEAGTWNLRIRNHHDHPDSTEENDVWVRIDAGPWQKVFSWQSNTWTWATNLELSEHDKPPASYELTSGQHRIEFSGRSTNFRMDRFHLYRPGTPGAESIAQPASPIQQPNRRPLPRVRATPDVVSPVTTQRTLITLDASDSFDLDGDDLTYFWDLRGGRFTNGTTETDPVVQVAFLGGIAYPVSLTVTEAGGEGRSTEVFLPINVEGEEGQIRGALQAWHPMDIVFHGPVTHEAADDPNPFLDYRLVVKFTGPNGQTYDIPGFYDGDGEGGSSGDVWRVRFAPDEGGLWSYTTIFRTMTRAALHEALDSGTATHFHGASGSFGVLPVDPEAEGFLGKGRLDYVGARYLKHVDGGFFLKGGTDSPENLMGYAGFDDIQDNGNLGLIHTYAPHVRDWEIGDPHFVSQSTGTDSKGLIGALNYLSKEGVNSVYFLPMNLGGDGQETCPFIGYGTDSFDKRHYDVSRMRQWEKVLDHATRKGILLHMVLAETEIGNRAWLDGGVLGIERKLMFRELVARFGHNLGIKWNLSEENAFPVQTLRDMADYLDFHDAYDHPIAVHTLPNDFSDYVEILGDSRFSATSIQYSPDLAEGQVEEWLQQSSQAGRTWILDMDENGPWDLGLNANNAVSLRKSVLYDVYFSGGQIEWYAGYHELPLGGDMKLEDFRSRQQMWRYMKYARSYLQENTPFWRMDPADHLVTGENGFLGGAEVLAQEGACYSIYLPQADGTGQLSLGDATGNYNARWWNPRSGGFVGAHIPVPSGAPFPLPEPPALVGQDWVLHVKRVPGS